MRFSSAVLAFVLLAAPVAAQTADPTTPPRIFLDQPLNIVEYQLSRLTPAQLERVPRTDTDARHRPIHLALLTRAGVSQTSRDAALAALVTLTKTSATEVLVGAAARVAPDQPLVVDQLARMAIAQPAQRLRGDRQAVTRLVEGASDPATLRVGYAALVAADATPAAAWQLAAGRLPHVAAFFRAASLMPASSTSLRAAVAPLAEARLVDSIDDMTGTGSAAAIAALAWARPDAATVGVVARALTTTQSDAVRGAAVSALLGVPEAAISPEVAETTMRAVLARLDATAPAARTSPAALDLRQLGERLLTRAPAVRSASLRRELRALGVQVVRLAAVPEEVRFDRRWFAVGAGRSVEVVLFNPDAMPHNVVVGQPGSLAKIGEAGNAMSMPTDPAVKPFVPVMAEVLFSTRLATQGETLRLTFVAPKTPGEYVFVCTFPGHWTRMYGVMLVVADLDAWEANPSVPTDPMTGRAFVTTSAAAPSR